MAPSTNALAGTLPNKKGSGGVIFTLNFFFGMVLLYIGERLILETPALRWVLDGLALVCLSIAIVGRILRRKAFAERDRPVETRLLICYLVGVGALLLYAAQADVVMERIRPLFSEAKNVERYQVALSALWPVLWLCAALPLTLMEISYSVMDVSKTLELARIQRSARSGLLVAMTLCLVLVVNYIGSEFNQKVDLSYFKTTHASESSRAMARNLTEPFTIYLFFPGANEVQEQVQTFFDDLKKESKHLQVKPVDYVLEPELAKNFSVTDNGVVVLSRGTQKEQISLGTKLERAKSTLKKLDSEFQAAFMKLSRTQKVVYFTVGHEERTNRNRDEVEGSGIRDVHALLGKLNYAVKDLGIGQGLAQEVPGDATLVLIVGPRKEFMPEEVNALKKYLLGGGHVMLFLDPEAGIEMATLLGPFGLKFTPVVLANKRFFYPVTYTPADHTVLFSNRFSSHPSITTLSRNFNQLATLFLGAGALSEIPSTEGHKVQLSFTIHSMTSTWNDLNKDFNFNPPEEQQKIYELAALSTLKVQKPALQNKNSKNNKKAEPPELRLIAVGDSDMISDKVLRNPGNAYFFVDAVKWLGGEEEYMGKTSSEEDVRIMHTRKEDQLWFYLTIFGVPALVLGGGMFYTHRRRRRS